MIEKSNVLDKVVRLMMTCTGSEYTKAYWALHELYDYVKAMPDERPHRCDFYVRDKSSGLIHRVGEDTHDGVWVDGLGQLHYHNMQNGDGCSGYSRYDDDCGYEFVSSDFGIIDEVGFNETEVPQHEDKDR